MENGGDAKLLEFYDFSGKPNDTIITKFTEEEIDKYLPKCVYDSYDEMCESEVCLICLVQFCDGDEIRLIDACNHIFHHNCIIKWIYTTKTCPTCKKSVMKFHKNNTLGDGDNKDDEKKNDEDIEKNNTNSPRKPRRANNIKTSLPKQQRNLTRSRRQIHMSKFARGETNPNSLANNIISHSEKYCFFPVAPVKPQYKQSNSTGINTPIGILSNIHNHKTIDKDKDIGSGHRLNNNKVYKIQTRFKCTDKQDPHPKSNFVVAGHEDVRSTFVSPTKSQRNNPVTISQSKSLRNLSLNKSQRHNVGVSHTKMGRMKGISSQRDANVDPEKSHISPIKSQINT